MDLELKNPLVLRWGRTLDRYFSLDDAVRSAAWALDSGEDWTDRIEIIDEPGAPSRILDMREVIALISSYERQAGASRPPRPPHVANVNVDGQVLESFYGDNGVIEAESLTERLRLWLGDRVQAVPTGGGHGR